MIKKAFFRSRDLECYLAGTRGTRYVLSHWPEAPEGGEMMLFSDDLRELLRYVVQYAGGLRIVPEGTGYAARNVEDPPEFAGRTLAEATENFWSALAEQIRTMGRECQLFERSAVNPAPLAGYLREWAFVEQVREGEAPSRPPLRLIKTSASRSPL